MSTPSDSGSSRPEAARSSHAGSPRSSLSRRAVLSGVAGLAAGTATPSAASPQSLTVMTRNLHVGVDLARLSRARSIDQFRRIVGRLLADVRAHPYAARMEAIAAEVAATRPDVLGIQEAVLVRTQQPGDVEDDPTPDAGHVVVDLLDLLASALSARGLDYEVAASTVPIDAELQGEIDGESVDVRVTDRTALLVRGDVETSGTRSGTFDVAMEYPVQGTTVTIERGYCTVDATVGGVDLTVATTHLESFAAEVRIEQAHELLDLLPADRPVALAGDLNSGPGGPTWAYDLLTGAFEGAYETLRSGADGYTCCQASDLRNDRSTLGKRVDAVLYRGGLAPTAVERVGADPADRVAADVDGEMVRLWPSDHAGVVATLRVPATSPTPPPMLSGTVPTATPDDDGERSVPLAGFGSVAAIVAVVVAAIARRTGED